MTMNSRTVTEQEKALQARVEELELALQLEKQDLPVDETPAPEAPAEEASE